MKDVVDIKMQIANSLKRAIKELTDEEIEPEVVVQNDLNKGDLSTNVAMIAFGKTKNQESRIKNYGSPMELAEKIVESLNSELIIHNSFRLIEAKSPGFINFWLSETQIIAEIERLLASKNSAPQKSEVILEFGDLNPFKEPHIGHLRNLSLGESLARLMEWRGNKIIRTNYEGDVGLHVAKALYGLLQIVNSKLQIAKMDEGTLEERVKLLGKAYAAGAKAYEEEENAKAEIISINNKIYKNDQEIKEIWEKGRKISLDYFEQLYKKLGIKYDKYYFESETAPLGKEIVENHPEVFEKHQGAYVFRGEKHGLHTRVFVTAQNYATYEGKDLALAVLKDKDYPNAKKSLIITANEQMEYFKVLIKALESVNKKIANKSSHLTVGFVNLKEGPPGQRPSGSVTKMSSRSGNIVPAFWLLEETKKRLKSGFKEVSGDVLDDLSVGAVKWGMLKFSRDSNISFSMDESVQIEGNAGPYMQYTYARTQSLLDKSSKAISEAKLRENLDPQLLALGRLVCQFEIMAVNAANNFSPNILSNYLYTLAQNFNHFYEKEKVIGSDKEEEKLLVVKAVGVVLEKGLYLLGISAPKKI